MKLFKLALGLAPVVLLHACASVPPPPPPEAVVELTGKTCVATPSLAGAISLTPEKKKDYYIVSTAVDAGKPCLTRGTMAGNYIVYALPAHGENHTITVGGVQEAVRTFAPSVGLLDADGNITRVFAGDRFATFGNTLGVQFIPTPQERYILVQSDPNQVGQSVSTFAQRVAITNGYAAGAGGYGYSYQIASGTEGSQNRTFSHEGTVVVTVQAIKGKIGLPDEK